MLNQMCLSKACLIVLALSTEFRELCWLLNAIDLLNVALNLKSNKYYHSIYTIVYFISLINKLIID